MSEPPPLSLRPLEESDLPELAEWLAGDEWPFHGSPRPELATTRRWVLEERRFLGADAVSHWILEDGERVGLIALLEMGDPTPTFDLRLSSSARGRGLGRRALGLLAEHVFTQTDKHRLEAHVRVDNVAMRRSLRGGGWAKEAHHRRAWPDSEGGWHDCVTYALLRSDWEAGTVTPVPFHHEP